MPENKVTPATEAKKPDPTVKAPGAASTTEQKAPASTQPPKATAPAEKPKEPPKAPQTPSPLPPRQPGDKEKTVAEPKKEDSQKAPTPAEQKKPEEKKPEEKKPEAKAPVTDPKPKATSDPKKPGEAAKGSPPAEPKKNEPIPLSADPKQPEAAPKGKPAEPPKMEDTKSPIVVSGKDKVEIPIDPKPAAKEEAPKVSEPEAAAPAQLAEGPKGISITQVFADRLAPPSEADLKNLPIPKEGEAFSLRLHPAYFFEFLEHPFTINRETKDYKDLYESIKENGIRDPVYVRPREKGGLEIISGHRRHDIGTQLNYPIPTIIVQADDDTARIAVVDGNLHRMDIPTSELARAAKMKMEALTRKAGRRSKMEQLTAPQKRSDQQVAEDMGMSRNQVQRLVRIDSLVPELKVTFSADELQDYFPGKLPTVSEAKRAIFDALDMRKKALEKQAQKKDIMNPVR